MTGFGMPLEVAKSTGCGRTCVRIALPTWKRIWTLRKNSYASLRRRTQKRLKALLPEWEARNRLNTVGSVAKSIPGTSVIGMILAHSAASWGTTPSHVPTVVGFAANRISGTSAHESHPTSRRWARPRRKGCMQRWPPSDSWPRNRNSRGAFRNEKNIENDAPLGGDHRGG